jgi:hypothetical protein
LLAPPLLLFYARYALHVHLSLSERSPPLYSPPGGLKHAGGHYGTHDYIDISGIAHLIIFSKVKDWGR